MKIKELLPIGSIVQLKGGQHKLMVCGIKQTDTEQEQEFDYISVLYPEGCMNELGKYLFDHSDIEQVFFRGFEDEERAEFVKKLDQFYARRTPPINS